MVEAGWRRLRRYGPEPLALSVFRNRPISSPVPIGADFGLAMASTTYCLDPRRVVSHTYAHRDSFRNNQNNTWFSRANRKQMIDEVVDRAKIIRRTLNGTISFASRDLVATSSTVWNNRVFGPNPGSKRLFWFGRCTETYRFSMSPWCSNSLKRRGFTCQPYIGRLGEYQVRVSLFAGHYCKWRSSGPGGSSGKLHGYDSGGLPSNRSRGTPQRIPATVVWFRNLS